MKYRVIAIIAILTVSIFAQSNMVVHINDSIVHTYFISDIDSITFNSSIDGLVAYYPFNNGAEDESENSHDGAVSGASLTVDRFGKSNSAYEFDGIDDYILIPDHNDLDMLDSLTICGWFYPTSSDGVQAILGKARSETNGGYNFIFHNDKVSAGLHNGTTNAVANCTDEISLNEWHFFTCFYDNTVIRLYIDGVQEAEIYYFGDNLGNTNQPLYIGNEATGLDRYFTGKIDDIRVYDRVLTDGEIQELYKAEK